MCEQHVHDVRIDVDRNAEWEQWLLFMADVHWDNPLCDRKLLARHLREAQERDARVFVFGDLFCLMNGKFDPRRSLGKVRPEHKVDDYLDAVISDAIEWWKPYAKAIIIGGDGGVELVTPGNHESAVMKSTGTDPLARFAAGVGCEYGTYQGWVRLMLRAAHGQSQSIKIRYHHGHGGGGVVTKGTLWPQRRAAWWPDADIVVTGHIHEQWSFPVTRERLTDGGKIRRDLQLHLSCPSYKSDTMEGTGWSVEKGHPPKPLGAWWIRLHWQRAAERVLFEEVRAQ